MIEKAREIELVEIVTTVAREDDAARLARTLIKEKSFACASWKPVRSIYSWNGEMVDEREIEISFKTLASSADRAERRLRELHPYETPAILRIPILRADQEYANWVRDNVAQEGE